MIGYFTTLMKQYTTEFFQFSKSKTCAQHPAETTTSPCSPHDHIPVGRVCISSSYIGDSPALEKNTLLMVHYMRGRMRLLFCYDASLVSLIKTFPYHCWDQHNRWWTVPVSELIHHQLEQFCLAHGW